MPLRLVGGSAPAIRLSDTIVPGDDEIKNLLAKAFQEDLGDAGDITSKALIEPHMLARGSILAKQDGVIAGLRCAELAFGMMEDGGSFKRLVKDGDEVKKSAALAALEGTARGLLTAERTALNFLGQLSGVATLTHRFVKAVAHTKAQIRDTRKTVPGLRRLQKYAVACGGGVNHRMGLYDALLIKDNHLAVSNSIADALQKARQHAAPGTLIEIEVDTLQQLEEALTAGALMILLDNMTPAEMVQAVELNNGRAALEASGGVTLQSVVAIAETGVDFISIGALTHSAPSLDVSLDFSIKTL